MRVIALRPQPACDATLAAGRALGMEMLGFSLFNVRGCEWKAPEGDVDGLLLGSANAIRHFGPFRERYLAKAVHCVGETTAQAARDAGYTVGHVGTGGLQAVLDALPPQRLLRLAGKERVKLSVPSGMQVETRVVYEILRLPFPGELVSVLGAGDALVLLHSAAAAVHFASECSRLELNRSAIALAALGPRIAQAAGEGWAKVASAPQPNEPALLALAQDMCH